MGKEETSLSTKRQPVFRIHSFSPLNSGLLLAINAPSHSFLLKCPSDGFHSLCTQEREPARQTGQRPTVC